MATEDDEVGRNAREGDDRSSVRAANKLRGDMPILV
jgi:hypothetical protein